MTGDRVSVELIEKCFEVSASTDALFCGIESKRIASELGFGSQEQWEIAIAVQELITNAVSHAGGGRLSIRAHDETENRGEPKVTLEIEVEDDGPGIEDFSKAALDGYLSKLLEGPHYDGLMRILALTHAGMTTGEFKARVEKWFATARHPRYGKPYDQLTYQPMQEVLSYLRANGFKTFIVSGGGADFMRTWSERVYGIPPEQVVGSTALTKYELRRSGPVLIKTKAHLFVDDGEGKPVGIHAFIGRRPIACFGNCDGDKAMLEYTTINNPRPSFGLIIHHTDAEREYAYDKTKDSGTLEEALQDAPKRGWIVVDMKKDWTVIFPFEKR